MVITTSYFQQRHTCILYIHTIAKLFQRITL